MSEVFDRATGVTYTEKRHAEGGMRFWYGTRLGSALLRPMATRRWFSELAALGRRTRRSVSMIDAFCAAHSVRLEDYVVPRTGWRSFADFFVRAWAPGARPLAEDPETLVSPADGKLLAVPLFDGATLRIKDSECTLDDLLGDPRLAARLVGGMCVVIRMTADDTHRYLYAASGKVVRRRRRGGVLHAASAVADGHPILVLNKRRYEVVDTDEFGRMVQMEVGAMFVGRIRNRRRRNVVRGDEKGRFELGGSTVVVLLEPGAVRIDVDLVGRSARGIETRVRAGERIGVRS